MAVPRVSQASSSRTRAWSRAMRRVVEASATTTLYLNGQQVARNTSSIAAIFYDASPVLIGADNQGGGCRKLDNADDVAGPLYAEFNIKPTHEGAVRDELCDTLGFVIRKLHASEPQENDDECPAEKS